MELPWAASPCVRRHTRSFHFPRICHPLGSLITHTPFPLGSSSHNDKPVGVHNFAVIFSSLKQWHFWLVGLSPIHLRTCLIFNSKHSHLSSRSQDPRPWSWGGWGRTTPTPSSPLTLWSWGGRKKENRYPCRTVLEAAVLSWSPL